MLFCKKEIRQLLSAIRALSEGPNLSLLHIAGNGATIHDCQFAATKEMFEQFGINGKELVDIYKEQLKLIGTLSLICKNLLK